MGPDPASDPPADAVTPGSDGGPVFAARSREDTDIGWGDHPEPDDERLYRDRPPHWKLE